ncbi:MAG: type II toxin-antitoxin system ParD family antitoxin [SAR202 cluster bacterium]|nr:type II toxin-antitoxin system ParD family antitoxin [SAR202 cluster bacterium]
MNVSLTPELEKYVRDKVDSGSYITSSEVVREALRLLQERDRIYESRLAELRREIKKGLSSPDAGELDFEAVKREGLKRLSENRG